jgi:hypothetical protein
MVAEGLVLNGPAIARGETRCQNPFEEVHRETSLCCLVSNVMARIPTRWFGMALRWKPADDA